MKEINVKPYDFKCVEEITHELFHAKELKETPEGWIEIPADSYQLILNGLEEARWFVHGEDRAALRHAMYIVENLRDIQRRREIQRNRKEA